MGAGAGAWCSVHWDMCDMACLFHGASWVLGLFNPGGISVSSWTRVHMCVWVLFLCGFLVRVGPVWRLRFENKHGGRAVGSQVLLVLATHPLSC